MEPTSDGEVQGDRILHLSTSSLGAVPLRMFLMSNECGQFQIDSVAKVGSGGPNH